MRERKWVDCPVCGVRGSMRRKTRLSENFSPAGGYTAIAVTGLDGQFCRECGEGFWSLKSERRIAAKLADSKAEQDSRRVVAADIASVQEAARVMRVSVQGIHKMMRTGRIRHVVVAGKRLPIRADVLKRAKAGEAPMAPSGK